jgi:hypothetical protein
VTAGRGLVDPPASSGTAIEPRHAGRYAAFIQEDQFFRRDRAEAVEELDPPLEVDRGIAFQRVERLFFIGTCKPLVRAAGQVFAELRGAWWADLGMVNTAT